MVTIQVFYRSSGKAAKNVGVKVSFDGLFGGGITKKEFTDSDGNAHFDSTPGRGKIFVSGTNVYEGRIEGRTIVYV